MPETITSADGLVFVRMHGVEGPAVWRCQNGPVSFYLVEQKPHPSDFSKLTLATLEAGFVEFDIRGFVFAIDIKVEPIIPVNVKQSFKARMEFILDVFRKWDR